ncbi:MAG: hypothetical protein JXQ72_10650 [Anaerolineae bacterium]|nr:hypothetical protein [Anaerolineae bacterium]
MSTNQRPEPAHKPGNGTPRPRKTDTGRYVPQVPVLPQFAEDQPAPEDSGRFWTGPHSPAVPPQEVNSCLLPLLGMGVVVISLLALALFLPPFSLWDRINAAISDDAAANGDSAAHWTEDSGFLPLYNRIQAGRLAVEAVTQVPYYVRVVVLHPPAYLAGNAPDDGWHCGIDLPAGYALASPVYSLTQSGTPPESFALHLAGFENTASALELYTWDDDAGRWEFLPAKPALTPGVLTADDLSYLPRCVAAFRQPESTRRAGVTLGLADTLLPEIAAAEVRVYPGRLRPLASGALDIVLAPGFATGQGYEVLPLIQNFDDPAVIDVATVQHILQHPSLRAEHARQITAFALNGQNGTGQGAYAGVVIDYRAIPSDLRNAYTAFLDELAALLHSQNRTLTVVLPMPDYNVAAVTWQTGGYDWQAIGRAADEVAILAPLDPNAYRPVGAIHRLLDWAVTQISRDQLLLGINALHVEDQSDGILAPVTSAGVLAYLGHVQVDPLTAGQPLTARLVNSYAVQAFFAGDDETQAAYLRYMDASGILLRTMWLTDPAALYHRLNYAAEYDLGGVYMIDLLAPDNAPDLAGALLAYRLHQDPPPAPDPAVEWTIRAGDTVVAQVAGQPDQPVTVELGDLDMNVETLTVEAHIAGMLLDSVTVSPAP